MNDMKLIMESWRKYVSDETLTESYVGDWAKHSTLNFGQVLRHLRYLTDLPDTPRLEALKQRLVYIANDTLYAILPPQTHHEPEEIAELRKYSYSELLRMGINPDFADEMLGSH
jgi:hypothetical protein